MTTHEQLPHRRTGHGPPSRTYRRAGPCPAGPALHEIAHMLLGQQHTAAWDQLISLLAPDLD